MGAAHQPVRIVIDTHLALSPDSRLGRSAGASAVWLCHGPDAPEAARTAWAATGARLITCTVSDGRIDPDPGLRTLAGLGLTRILCEGGGQLAAALIRAGLVTDIVAFTAGTLIGQDGVPAVGPLHPDRLAGAPGFDLISTSALGNDTLSCWTRRP
jgi:diaminohydroxyphosphoribosylaminopyrimidine deaminase/5-amino-6-(5-phosphoribosylamino)uracil reductase